MSATAAPTTAATATPTASPTPLTTATAAATPAATNQPPGTAGAATQAVAATQEATAAGAGRNVLSKMERDVTYCTVGGVDLKMDHARDTLENLYRVWTRPVHVLTRVDGAGRVLSFNGSEHSDKAATYE